MKVDSWFKGFYIHWSLVLASVVLAFLPPVRRLLRGFVTQPGNGPDEVARAKESVEYRGIAIPDDEDIKEKAFVKARFEGSLYVCKLNALVMRSLDFYTHSI